MGVSAEAPWTDCAYKLVEYAGRPVLKLSTKKQTLPGAKQVFRYRDPGGAYLRDIIASASEAPKGAETLLGEVVREGKCLRPTPALEELRQRFRREFACLPERHKALTSPESYDVRISQELQNLQRRVVEEVKRRELGPENEAACHAAEHRPAAK